jgi:hypothetical protein
MLPLIYLYIWLLVALHFRTLIRLSSGGIGVFNNFVGPGLCADYSNINNIHIYKNADSNLTMMKIRTNGGGTAELPICESVDVNHLIDILKQKNLVVEHTA